MSTGSIATSGTKPTRVPATPRATTGSASPPQSRAQPAAHGYSLMANDGVDPTWTAVVRGAHAKIPVALRHRRLKVTVTALGAVGAGPAITRSLAAPHKRRG